MTRGERFVGSLSLKSSFRDAHERRSYLRMVEIAKAIIDNPEAREQGRAFLDRFVRDDPRQRRGWSSWSTLIDAEPTEIVRQLLEDCERGADLRDSAPVFVTIEPAVARAAWSSSP